MKQKYFFVVALFLVFISVLAVPKVTQAAETVTVYFLHSDTCSHCKTEGIFLDVLEKEYGDQLIVKRYEVHEEPEVYKKFASSTNGTIQSVPVTFVGDDYFVGYGTDDTSGEQLRQLIDVCLATDCPDNGAGILAGPADADNKIVVSNDLEGSLVKHIPLIGDVDLSKYSLFGFTAVVAAIDGFNPCAMWVLLILIGMLLGMQNRRRMWLLGIVFIAASAGVYFIFLAAWLEFFKFVGMVRLVQVIIGLVALGVGVYYLRRFTKMKPGECEVTDVNQRKKIAERIKKVVREKALWIALPGIIGVAFIVNLIELACSAGLPAIFTQVLALNDLSRMQYYLYLLLYIFIFMLDDMVIFIIAMITLKAVGTTGKYSRYATLVGGIVIVLMGVLLLFKPEWLSIG